MGLCMAQRLSQKASEPTSQRKRQVNSGLVWCSHRNSSSGKLSFSVQPLICAVWALEEKEDRKSTRLNSSHANISYAVFCLKKKKKKENREASSNKRKKENI